MVRKPAVSGRFYPAQKGDLLQAVDSYLEPAIKIPKAIGIVAPHAGYMYSGHVAGSVYSRIELPPRNIVLCPNHTGRGTPLSIMKSGAWHTPLGDMEVDSELADALSALDPDLEEDMEAHRFEHAIEVQLPFMQRTGGPAARFVPITIGTANLAPLLELGKAIARLIRQNAPGALVIASSDMNHYESDAVTRKKDQLAIDQILAMNAEGLYDVVRQKDISMCGYGPTVSMLTAAKDLGAKTAELVKYATSGEISMDFDHVVGYAGFIVS
jgi:AmmeMemoRadiSam system protein B